MCALREPRQCHLPRPCHTQLLDDQRRQKKRQKMIRDSAGVSPLGSRHHGQDCAAAAVFPCTDQARNITGILMPIDGGYTAR